MGQHELVGRKAVAAGTVEVRAFVGKYLQQLHQQVLAGLLCVFRPGARNGFLSPEISCMNTGLVTQEQEAEDEPQREEVAGAVDFFPTCEV